MTNDHLSTTPALADPTRRAILSRTWETSVLELARPFEMSLPVLPSISKF
jgi:hypothetical protein